MFAAQECYMVDHADFTSNDVKDVSLVMYFI